MRGLASGKNVTTFTAASNEFLGGGKQKTEYHSFAFAGPLFRTPVAWRSGERRRDGAFVQLDLKPTGADVAGSGAG